MKTHINQLITVVSFFSLSISTIIAISWGMNGLLVKDTNHLAPCLINKDSINVIQPKACNKSNLEYNESMKILIPKITIK